MFWSEKNAYIKDLNALRILMNFLCIYLCRLSTVPTFSYFFLLFLLFCFDPTFSYFFIKSSYYSYFFIKKWRKKVYVSESNEVKLKYTLTIEIYKQDQSE